MIFAACGEEPTNGAPATSVSNMDLMPANVQKLMTSGDQLVNDSVDSYTGITNQEFKDLVKAYVDYTLFPIDFESGYTAQERLKAYLGGTNNLMTAYKIQQNIVNGDPLNTGIEGMLPRSVARKITLGKIVKVLNLAGKIPGFNKTPVGMICAGVAKGLAFIDKLEKKQKAEQVMQAIGSSLNAYVDTSMLQYLSLDNKMDVVIMQLNVVLADLSFLHTAVSSLVADSGMLDVKSSYDGFMDAVSVSTLGNISNTVYHYYVVSSDFYKDLNKFITCASNIQQWAVDPANTNTSGYSFWLRDDPKISTNYQAIYAYRSHTTKYSYDDKWITTFFDYINPARHVFMSLGNLEYMSKMILNRMSMQPILYSGTTLSTNNLRLARYFLDMLAPLKSAAENAYLGMKEQYENMLGMHPVKIRSDYGTGDVWSIVDGNGQNFDWDGALNSSKYDYIACESDMLNRTTVKFRCGYYIAKDKVKSETYSVDNVDNIDPITTRVQLLVDHMKPLLPAAYESAKTEYLVHYFARLAILETILRSYL